jgi:hypothetical protein
MPGNDRDRISQMRNNLMAMKKMHPEIMPWQMGMLQRVRHPEILALFAGLVDYRKAAGKWLNKAIELVDKDFEDPKGPVRLWFRTQKPSPYEVIKGLLEKARAEKAKAAAVEAPAAVPAPAPEAEPEKPAEEPVDPPKKPRRRGKSKSA